MEHLELTKLDSPRSISILFHVSMWWRIFYGSLRIVLAFVLFKLVGTPFTDILRSVMGYEIAEDPTDIIFQTLYAFFETHAFTVSYFVASYLLFWGTIDVVLSAFLLKHKLWAFPSSLVLMTVFIIYEVYRLFHTHSLILLWVILVDVAIIYLIYREYRILKCREDVPLP
ncbi:MAG TPA: DUF2127 domain-containing protein [Candidatus Paceibacterota bacterium]|nr:DUF2127 domain-containing protein [Candidatus Paceibacterota bacterium]